MNPLESAINYYGLSLIPYGIPVAYYMLYWSYERRSALVCEMNVQWEAMSHVEVV